jgi:hypothetical protein
MKKIKKKTRKKKKTKNFYSKKKTPKKKKTKNFYSKNKILKKKKTKNFYSKKKTPPKKNTHSRKKFSKKKSIRKFTIKRNTFKKKESFIFKIIKLQNSFNSIFKFRIEFSLEKHIQKFFDGISNTITDYQTLKSEEKRKTKLEEIEKKERERIFLQKKKILEEEFLTRQKQKALKEELKLEKERKKDIKTFLRKEQALLRIEQAERQKQFLKQLQLEKQIEKFRIREVKELEKIEKISLREKREDYAGLQERIEKLKDKYRIIRDQKIRERVEALGVKIQGDEDRETLLQKEKDYTIARQKIELSLESFYRSAGSLVFQLNKRHVTRHMSILRCIDKRFETGEIFIKWDETVDEDWLLLIYIKNNSPDEGIVIEDKTNIEKHSSHEFKSNEIFKASDLMVDSLTQLIASKRAKSSN